jgi:hypothetical protein
MMTRKISLSIALVLASTCGFAQQAPAPSAAGAAPARPPQAPLQIPNPQYATVSDSITVNAPQDVAWNRIGHFCDIGAWFPLLASTPCTYLAGDGDMGTVRSVVHEVLVSKTPYSYTYTQAPRVDTPYNLYHGTLEVVPLTSTTSRVSYVVFYDAAAFPDDAARQAYVKNRQDFLRQHLANIKILAETGKLPASIQPMAPSNPPAPFLNPSPHYVTVPMEIQIHAPADVVWSHIGHYCDLARLGSAGFPNCTITSGTDGEYGAVRSIGNEILVGKTKYSYTYTQPLRTTGFYPLYHGTVEARADTPDTTTLYWTLVYDNSNLADDAARENDVARRRTRFMGMLEAVKTLSEGGTLPSGTAGQPPASAK